MIRQATVIGDGAMGSVCALLLVKNGARVRLWTRDPALAKTLNTAHENPIYLPGHPLPVEIEASSDPAWPFVGTELVVSAIPCQFVRQVWKNLARHLPSNVPIVSVTKGIENETLLRPTQILEQICGARRYAVLSGPSIAHEVVNGLPATVVVASADQELAKSVQQCFYTPTFRVYTNPDTVGVELAGAVKNVIALAAGIIDGLKLGDNAKAALVTRGSVEISRLGVAMGARAETFVGLAGVGDLITTCISPYGRNRSAGERIGRGESVEQIVSSMTAVIEGIATTRSVMGLARKHNVDMPITQAVYSVLFEKIPPAQALHGLMTRQLKSE